MFRFSTMTMCMRIADAQKSKRRIVMGFSCKSAFSSRVFVTPHDVTWYLFLFIAFHFLSSASLYFLFACALLLLGAFLLFALYVRKRKKLKKVNIRKQQKVHKNYLVKMLTNEGPDRKSVV